ncbi:Hypothetical protein BN69_3405 [Methylocystis sp. SC2]|nr:Hypothetical protein BN69_3405 [Methylocystis sp. SC2]
MAEARSEALFIKSGSGRAQIFLFELRQGPSSSLTYWLFCASAEIRLERGPQRFLKARTITPIRGAVGVAFMVHAIIFAAVALFALIGALTA